MPSCRIGLSCPPHACKQRVLYRAPVAGFEDEPGQPLKVELEGGRTLACKVGQRMACVY